MSDWQEFMNSLNDMEQSLDDLTKELDTIFAD